MGVGPSPYLANGVLAGITGNLPLVVPVLCASVHDGDPGTNATANTVTTDEGRDQITSAAPTGGIAASTGDPATWGINEGTTLTHIGLWDAFSAGNWLGNTPVDQPVQVADGDVVTLSSFRIQIPGLA